ncbi:Ankyrin repeat protein 1 [Giardia muris]|uniref:Ankyrin repeat protein 1 n=1 Tax=Giardia muris TaxID=5742 RepID=A0A4Z1SZA9_GIAMU|nr:Ankyrin repeat protein 1 [Giardia muris]|eukprot:TNJ30095.1 Ankyrin repeat protein 1 [Giardia muris]
MNPSGQKRGRWTGDVSTSTTTIPWSIKVEKKQLSSPIELTCVPTETIPSGTQREATIMEMIENDCSFTKGEMIEVLTQKVYLSLLSEQVTLCTISRLMWAALRGKNATVRSLLELEKGYLPEGVTPLMLAAKQGHIGTVCILLDEFKEMRCKKGYTALMHAVLGGHYFCVEALLCEAKISTNEGITPLHLAAHLGNDKMLRLFHQDFQACPIDSNGLTPLMYAAKEGHEKCVEMLAQHQAMKITKNGDSALILAVKGNHLGAVRVLIVHERPMIREALEVCVDVDIRRTLLSHK